MVKLSKEAKQRLQQLFKGGQFAIRWGFIPLVIYLGHTAVTWGSYELKHWGIKAHTLHHYAVVQRFVSAQANIFT
ncbi:hypothetical protein J1605_003034 [Eschrichtius robustus]|uniref:Mitochondrial import receptor subunit TOM7 homolog n=1 Tax=Eschrichtius robustus TaxID=9764 RepID=A0AB34HUB7_ESCRO|nr:hypothetical protein J1605_003034 [Eschrichtius robustus]